MGRCWVTRPTCKRASDSEDNPGQEGEEARGAEVQAQGTHEVGWHPVEQNEVRPVVHKICSHNGPGCLLGQEQLPGTQHACSRTIKHCIHPGPQHWMTFSKDKELATISGPLHSMARLVQAE